MTYVLIALAWLLWAALISWISRNPRGDLSTGLGYRGCQLYSRFGQRTAVVGREHIPQNVHPGPLIIAANHTAGVDPVIVQAACRFEIRWMMGSDMMHPKLNFFWKHFRMIPVNRAGRDSASAKEGIRHVNSGGVLGIFPEGGIERPYGQLLPFLAGVGLIMARTKAPVLPVFISGTSESDTAMGSFLTRGNARLTFGPIMTFDNVPGPEIVKALRAWFDAQAA